MLIDISEEDIKWISATLEHLASGAPLTPPNKEGVLDRLNEAIKKSATTELEDRVRSDYARVANRVLLLGVGTTGLAFIEGTDDQEEFVLDTPALVQVEATDELCSLIRWQGDHIDPYWDVRLLEEHPQLSKFRSICIDGQSYSAAPDGEHEKPVSYVLVGEPGVVRFEDADCPETLTGVEKLQDLELLLKEGFHREESGNEEYRDYERIVSGFLGEPLDREQFRTSGQYERVERVSVGAEGGLWSAVAVHCDVDGNTTHDRSSDCDGTLKGAIAWLMEDRESYE
jgi:hypothetical protein